ncbi:Flp pilus assembly protein CpaB [Sphingomonas sp.]|uniref:Flp pilus assembly protein CpaB n=1 Tax=Sphingomonas sp. TaxID=28214 RepID=UPI001ED67942|nr:Flp pilus assembly protein CpaB [Sphingomonas sp.]MBX3593123.1 Flp pilus assembly protein CpaB [Sphingomonas sp.]
MDGRKIILLAGALIVAAITAFMARSLMSGSSAPVAGAVPIAGQPAPIDGVEVLVATKALPIGTILGPESMKFVAWPKDLVEGAYFKRDGTDLKSLQGTVVRYAIPAGQPLTQGALVKPGDRGFLAAALAPGMRAVTVPVSAQAAVAGFVFPGDRVDLILTQAVPGGGDGPPLKASETVLRNLRVLATDQRTDKQSDENGKTVVATYSTVTVEATPRIAEKIAVAQTIGALSLSLRSIADNAGDLEEAIAAGEVTVGDGDAKSEKAMLARAGSRPVESGTTVSTGADVSRFQRSTVPGKPKEQMMLGGPVAPGAPAAAYPGAGAMPEGPIVKVARGTAVTVVPVGGKN